MIYCQVCKENFLPGSIQKISPNEYKLVMSWKQWLFSLPLHPFEIWVFFPVSHLDSSLERTKASAQAEATPDFCITTAQRPCCWEWLVIRWRRTPSPGLTVKEAATFSALFSLQGSGPGWGRASRRLGMQWKTAATYWPRATIFTEARSRKSVSTPPASPRLCSTY